MDILWLEQSTDDIRTSDVWLSPAEKLRLDAMRFPRRRADWRLGRWTAKRVVSAYLCRPCLPEMLALIEIRSAPSGAPEAFLENEPAGVSISITHRVGIAACAVAPSETTIGCDLELIEPRSGNFLTDYFTAKEQALVQGVSAAEQIVSSTLLWSAKESALKALKAGLRFDTRSVEVSLGGPSPTAPTDFLKVSTQPSFSDSPLDGGDWRPLTVTQANGQAFRGWWLYTGQLVRTIVTAPPSSAPMILSAFLRSDIA
jgi:4'-phosphopantetheinyl transferase